jgi:hypothetical protein
MRQKWANLFKDWMNKYGFVELKNSSRAFTWTNNQETPIMAALDNFFCTTNFEQKFALAFVFVKARATSDHTTLILDLRIKEVKKTIIFRFEKWWLE